MSNYAIAKFPTPIFNTPQIPYQQTFLSKNDQGLIKSIETIAFKETKFQILKKISPIVAQVCTQEYPSEEPLYVDSRFLLETSHEPPERKKQLPPPEKILQWMASLVGTRYFWGGNWTEGIPEMATLYSHLHALEDKDDILCKGIDCSGLLYQATDGITPRNTSQLIHYGKELLVNLNSPTAVQNIVNPLDMIVWKGHVTFVLNSEAIIESRHGKGVTISPFIQRYSEILEQMRTENKTFYLRRWYPPDLLT